MEEGASKVDSSFNKFVTVFNRDLVTSKMHYYQIEPGKRNRLIPKLFSLTMTRLMDITGYRVVSNDGYLYVIGGRERESGSLRKSVLRFDTRDNTWRTGAEMRTPRIRHSATVIRDLIYVVGGEGKGGKVLSSVELYDPAYDMWVRFARLPHPTAGHAACSLHSTLYISGGCTDINQSLADSFLKFDVDHDDFWSDAVEREDCIALGITNELPGVREKHSMVTCMNKIYCFGGITVKMKRSGQKPQVEENVYVFDPGDPGWKKEPYPTLNPRCSAGHVVLGHDIFFIGGQKMHGTAVPTVEYYNTVTKKYTEVFSISEAGFSDVNCCVIEVPTSNKEFSSLGRIMKSNWILW